MCIANLEKVQCLSVMVCVCVCVCVHMHTCTTECISMFSILKGSQ